MHQRAAQCDPLLHSPGELPGPPILEAAQADLLEQHECPRASGPPVETAHVGLQHDIAENSTPIKQQVPLEGNSDVSKGCAYLLLVDFYVSFACRNEASDHHQQGAFSAATRSQDRQKLARAISRLMLLRALTAFLPVP